MNLYPSISLHRISSSWRMRVTYSFRSLQAQAARFQYRLHPNHMCPSCPLIWLPQYSHSFVAVQNLLPCHPELGERLAACPFYRLLINHFAEISSLWEPWKRTPTPLPWLVAQNSHQSTQDTICLTIAFGSEHTSEPLNSLHSQRHPDVYLWNL